MAKLLGHRLPLALLLLLLLLLLNLLKPTPCLAAAAAASKRESVGQLLSQLSGFVFSGKVLWQVDAGDHQPFCQLRCLWDTSCVAYTYVPGGQCVAYATVLGLSDSSTLPVPGARTHLLKRVPPSVPLVPCTVVGQTRCAETWECDLQGSNRVLCGRGVCQCTWGHFFSLSAHTCLRLADCKGVNDTLYQPTDHYPLQTDKAGHALFSHDAVTEAQCSSLCSLLSACLAVNYHDSNNGNNNLGPSCVGFGADALDHDPQGQNLGSGSRYKQKVCL